MSRISKGGDMPFVAVPLEQERRLQRDQPRFHERLHSFKRLELFFADTGNVVWDTPMAMLAGLVARHDRRPFASGSRENPYVTRNLV